MIYRVLYIPGGDRRIPEASTSYFRGIRIPRQKRYGLPDATTSKDKRRWLIVALGLVALGPWGWSKLQKTFRLGNPKKMDKW